MIMKFPPHIRIAEDLAGADADVAIPLGSIEFIREALNVGFPGIEWSDPAWGVWSDASASTTLHANLGGEEPGERRSIMVSVDGDAPDDVVTRILAVARQLDWKIIDTATRVFVSDAAYDEETRRLRNEGNYGLSGGSFLL